MQIFHRGRLSLFIAVCSLAASVEIAIPARQETNGGPGVPLATQDRVRNPGWWPTKGTAFKNEYAGEAACAECHSAKAATQKATPMANAAMAATDSVILRGHGALTFVSGSYTFKISKDADHSVFSVAEGEQTVSQSLDWAFGTGEVGQTYVYQREGTFYESRVSFYPAIQALDLTLGHHAPGTGDLAGALGRAMAAPEVRLCFGCHTTRATTGGHFEIKDLIPGVTCEACHGPGAKHVAAMRNAQFKPGLQAIFNPARLSPVDSVDFCGACHRTAWDVLLSSTTGVADVRFQPYRLERSRCWGKGDARLTCVACHDPHLPLVRDPAAYDSRCLSCHASSAQAPAAKSDASAHTGRSCPVSTNKCVTCHMPKYEIPGSHAQFTDHWIRVVATNAPYPE